MADSIREQIIQAIMDRLEIIRTANAYQTESGATVERARKKLDPSDLPALVVWPKAEARVGQYATGMFVMPVQIDAMAAHGSVNPSVVSEQLLADLIEAMAGPAYSRTFTSGGTYEIEAGDTITGATSKSTALVQSVTLSTGTWAGGDAAGTLTLRRVTGTFAAENLNVGSQTNVATIAGDLTPSDPIDLTTDGLAEQIEYAGGGIDSYPDESDQVVGVVTNWNIKYRTNNGDPYHQ